MQKLNSGIGRVERVGMVNALPDIGPDSWPWISTVPSKPSFPKRLIHQTTGCGWMFPTQAFPKPEGQPSLYDQN